MKVRIYNSTLEPNIWNSDMTINSDVLKALQNIAQTFYKETEFKVPLEDVLFLGSCANYNWTKTSDIDLHILIDSVKIAMPEDYKKKFMKSIAYRWNTEHDIHIKGHNVELYLQDINETNRSTGIYSVGTAEWIQKPNPQKIVLDKGLIQNKYSEIVKKLEDAIKESNVDKLRKVMKDIVDMREAGLSREGEFSTENIVFKILRTRGFLGKLKDAINQNYDKLVSVKEGYGMADPSKDPKAVGRWTIKWDSDSKILKEMSLRDDPNIHLKAVGYGNITYEFNVSDHVYVVNFKRIRTFTELSSEVYTMGSNANIKNVIEYQDILDNNVTYSVSFYRRKTGSFMDKTYLLGGDLKQQAIKVYSSVLNATHKFLNHVKPDIIIFSAAEIDQAKIYTKFIPRFLKEHSYSQLKRDPINDTILGVDEFVFIKDSLKNSFGLGEGFDPQSQSGPNPAGSLSVDYPTFYDDKIKQMRKMDEFGMTADPEFKFDKNSNTDEYTYSFTVGTNNYKVEILKIKELRQLRDSITFDDIEDTLSEDEKEEYEVIFTEHPTYTISFYNITQDPSSYYQQKDAQVRGDAKHQAVRVYSEVMKAVYNFVSKYHPDIIMIVPAEVRQGEIYSKFVDRFLNKFNYIRVKSDPISGTDFRSDEFFFVVRDLAKKWGFVANS